MTKDPFFSPIRPGATSADLINLSVILASWVLTVVLVNPIGDFPLNDDWSYGRTVQWLVENGEFRLSDWTATNLLSQVIWGALFCLPFGFSFTALRFSTLALGLVGVVATYALLREMEIGPRKAVLGSLLLGLNPVYFALASSFMSDVPYYAFAVCSTWFFLRGLRTDSVVDSVVGTALASIAVLDRQLGLAMPLAFGLALLSTKRLGLRNVGIAFTPTAFVLGMQFLYQKALQFSGRLPALYNQQALLLSETWSREAEQTMRIVVKNASFGLVYVGLFVFPFLLAVCPLESRHRSRRNGALNRAALSLLSVLAIAVFFSKRRQMPLFGNVLHETGIGPLSVLWGWASLPVPPTTTALVDAFWKLATIVGVIGAVSLLYRFSVGVTRLVGSARVKSEKVKRTDAFVLSLLLINFAPITLLERGVYDRYVLPMLPLSLMLVGISCARIDDQRVSRSMVIAFVVTILMGGFTVAATHDYLSWNRVRWLASRELTEDSSISLEDLNGGFEFRGWHFGYRLESCNPSYEGVSSRPRVSWDDFTCLEGPDDHYTYGLSFAARDGYEVMRRYPVDAWLPFSPDRILVLRKEL